MPRRTRSTNLLLSLPLTLTLMACVVAALPATPTGSPLPEPTATPRTATRGRDRRHRPNGHGCASGYRGRQPRPRPWPPLASAFTPTRSAPAWQRWLWDPITRNLNAAAPVHGGTHAIAVTYTGGWSGLKPGLPRRVERRGVLPALLGPRRRERRPAGDGDARRHGRQPGAGADHAHRQHLDARDHPADDVGSWPSIGAVDFFNNTDHAQPVFYVDDLSWELLVAHAHCAAAQRRPGPERERRRGRPHHQPLHLRPELRRGGVG